jgi:hypothetical protein
MLDVTQLRALREKYEEMLVLRVEHDAKRERDVRPRLQELARRFPGALREIDDLPLADVQARIDALRAAERDPSLVTSWMTAIHLFHSMTRGALCAKKWLAGRKGVDEATVAAFEVEAAQLCWADEARAWAGELSRVASPPRGRVTDLVFERIARVMKIDEDGARELVFGVSCETAPPK